MKQLIVSGALVIAMSTSGLQAGEGTDPVVSAATVAADARDTSGQDMQMVLAMLTLGMVIALAFAH